MSTTKQKKQYYACSLIAIDSSINMAVEGKDNCAYGGPTKI